MPVSFIADIMDTKSRFDVVATTFSAAIQQMGMIEKICSCNRIGQSISDKTEELHRVEFQN